MLLAVLMFLTATDVILRYLFNSPITGAYELTGFMLLGTVCIGFAYVQGQKANIALTMLVDKLPQRFQLLCEAFGIFVGLVVFGAITYTGWFAAWESLSITEFSTGLVEFPVYPVRFVLLVGAGLMCLRLIMDIAFKIARFLESFSSE